MCPGINARLFWGSGTLVGVLQLDANATIPEEELPADRFMFVLEDSVDQLLKGELVSLHAKEREAPDGAHSGTPVTEFVYLEKGTKNALTDVVRIPGNMVHGEQSENWAVMLWIYSGRPMQITWKRKKPG